MRALVVEDNVNMGRLVERVLADAGADVTVAPNGEMGQYHALSSGYDVIVLDIMLPDIDGVDLCRGLRRQGVRTPVLMLTMRSTTDDRVRGLDAGADDYLVKPFEASELLARIRALVRRGQNGGVTMIRVADVEMDLLGRTVRRSDRPIMLTAKEFALLEYFMRNPDRVLTRTEIGEHVWDMNFDPASNVIEVFVSALRRKLGDPPLIETQVGVGYKLVSTGALAGKRSTRDARRRNGS